MYTCVDTQHAWYIYIYINHPTLPLPVFLCLIDSEHAVVSKQHQAQQKAPVSFDIDVKLRYSFGSNALPYDGVYDVYPSFYL